MGAGGIFVLAGVVEVGVGLGVGVVQAARKSTRRMAKYTNLPLFISTPPLELAGDIDKAHKS